MICTIFLLVIDSYRPKKQTKKHGSRGGNAESSPFREWNGTGFSSSFLRGIGTGRDYKL